MNPMIQIYQAESEQDLEQAEQLNLEYLSWCVEESQSRLGETLDLKGLLGNSQVDRKAFMAESGRLLLARTDGLVGGIACLKKIRDDTCEIKRMFVRPQFRGRKIGENLLSRLIVEAMGIGYSRMLLDSDPYMTNAHSMYRSMGFAETEPYAEAEMDGDDYSRHMIYMELILK
mgnify:CR=1 FL=1